jgi:hypothetical protein
LTKIQHIKNIFEIAVNSVDFPAQYIHPAAKRKRYLGNDMKKLTIGQTVTILSATGKPIKLTILSFEKIGTCNYANTVDHDGDLCPFSVKFLLKKSF